MRDFLILAIVFGSVPFILARPWLGILLWYWLDLMSPHRLGWGAAVHAPVAQTVAIATLVALVYTKDRKAVPFTSEVALFGLFAIHITVTSYFAWGTSAWMQWEKVMKILLITAITPILVYGRQRIMWLVIVVVLSISFYGLKGGIFSIATGGAHRVWGPYGTFIGDNTSLGMAMTMVLPLLLVTARAVKEGRLGIPMLDRWASPLGYVGYSIFWLTITAIIFTYSRGAWLALLAVAPFIFLRMRRRWLLAALGFVMAGTIVAMLPDQLIARWETIQNYHEDNSAMTRLQAWGVNWNMAIDSPLVGKGFANYAVPDELWLAYANWVAPWASASRAVHSVYFQMIGEHGFLGAAIYFSMLLSSILTLAKILRESKRRTSTAWMHDIAWAILVSLFGFFIAGAFLSVAYFPLVYLFVAMAVVMRRELESAQQLLPVQGKTAETASTPEIKRPAFPDFVAKQRRE